MSTETVSVPVDDKIEEKVNEETPKTKQCDSPPPKDDLPKVEKEDLIPENSVASEVSTTKVEETPEDNQTEPPTVVECQKVDDVPAKDGAKEVENCVQEPEAVIAVEDLAVEKPAVESVDDAPVEEIAVETVEKECEKVETVKVDENKPVEKVADEDVKKAGEKAETIEADHNTPVEKVVIEEVEKEAGKAETVEADENVLVETIACETVDREPETAQAIEADEDTPVEKVATEEVEKEAVEAETIVAEQVETVLATEAVDKEPKMAQATESEESTPVKNVVCEEVEKEAEKEQTVEALVETIIATETVDKELETTQAIELDCTKPDGKRDVEPVEKQIDDEKPEENVATDSAVSVIGETQTTENKAEEVTLVSDAEKPVAEITEKEAGVVDVAGGLLKEEVCENSAEKEEKIVETEQQTEDNEKAEAAIQTGAEVTDRDLVDEAKEVLVKEEEVYKDIKENEEVVGPSSAIVEPPQAHKNSLLDVMALDTSKPDDQANKVESGEETAKESNDESKQEVVSVKSAQKQSGGGIISKVKQSIVKVKKAIIGKSPSSKVLAPEVKADEHVQ